MTITPNRMLINDPIPALGKLVRPVEPEKVDAIAAFERGNHAVAPVWVGFDMAVYGSDSCVAAEYSVVGKTVTIRNVPLTPPPPIAETKAFKVGDTCKLVAGGYAGEVATIAQVFSSGGYDITGFGFYEEYELELIPPKTEANGWVEWKGGECPVAEKACIQYRMRDQEGVSHSANGAQLRWTHRPADCPRHCNDIVAYRLLP